MYRTIVQAVLAHGEASPDKLAVALKKTQITYSELCRQIKNMAAKLKNDFKIGKGDFVMLQGVSKPDYVVAWLAVQYLGAVSVPMDKAAKEENILDVYEYASPKLMLTDSKIQSEKVNAVSLKALYEEVRSAAVAGSAGEQMAESAVTGSAGEQMAESAVTGSAGEQAAGNGVAGSAGEQAAGNGVAGSAGEQMAESAVTGNAGEQMTENAVAGSAGEQMAESAAGIPEYRIPGDAELSEILFTTGTTGKPKGTMLSIGNIYASTHNTWHGVGMLETDTVLIPLPLNHSIAMRVLRTTLYIGATVVLQNGFTFARELENNIAAYHCTGLVSVPASMEVVYRQMQEHFPEIMGKLRYMEVGAGSLGYDMKKKLRKAIPDTKVVNTWGSTETGGAIFLNVSAYPEKLTSIGKPIDGVEFKVVGQDGSEIQARDMDSAGRMALRGDMQMMGYYRMPEATAQTLVDGWLYTNDIVYTDEDGYVYMLGRADDIINVGGEKVSPVEVENIAQEFEEIRECACIGVADPDGIMGQIPVLFVVPEEEGCFHEDGLLRFLAARMEKYKFPQRFALINELPRNRMKKLNRRELHRIWQESEGGKR